MIKKFYFLMAMLSVCLTPLSMSAQCVTRNVTNCKSNTPNDAIGVAMVGQLNNNMSCCFFTDGSNGSFLFEPGATFSECADGTATLTGIIYQFGNTARRFSVRVNYVQRSCTLAPGANQETNNLPPGASTSGWYYYTLASGTLTGLDQCAGASLTLVQHMMASQVGVNGHNQGVDVGKLGLAGWFEWQVVTQPSNNWLFIAPYVNGTSVGDFCFVLDGPTPTYCNTDPCTTNPVPTPILTVTNATNGAANGCITITNLPSGASSSLNGGTASVGKTQYCGLAAGTYTITVNLNGCIKTATVTVVNNNTDPCLTNPVPTPTVTVSNATNGAANGCITITNLPSGASSSLNGGTATVGKTQYCGLAAGTYTITVNLNGCIKTITVTITTTPNCTVTGNTISKSCVNGVPVLTGSAFTGYEFIWLKSTYGCPNQMSQAIAGATGQDYTLPSRVSTTTYFVRCVRPIGCTTWSESNCITVYVTDCAPNCTVIGNTISKSCMNGVPVLTGSTFTGYEFIWLKSTYGCPNQMSQAIAGATGQDYTLPSRVSTTTYFVRCARPIGCTTWSESNCITVYATDCAPNPCITFDPTKCYKIVNRLNGRCLNVSGWSQSNNAATNTWSYNSQANQQWKIQSIGSGYYKVMSRNSGKVLANHWTNNNSSCYQYDYYTGGCGDWSFTCNSEGYFIIKHRLSGRCLDLKDAGSGSISDGCNTVIYNSDGSNSQQWQIVEVNCAWGQYSATPDVLTMDAHAEINRSRIEWVNNTGFKNDFFTVEKMDNATGNFEKMEIQNTIYSNKPEQYVSYDKNPTEGDNFYRVGVTFENGTVKYSETKKVIFSTLSTLRVFPNPADDFLDIDLKQYKGSAVSIYLYNNFGQQVQFTNIENVTDGTTRLNIASQGTGNYILRVTSKSKRDVTKQVVIAK